MIMDEETAAIISDERASTYARHYDFFNKLFNFTDPEGKVFAIVGGTGDYRNISSILDGMYNPKYVKENVIENSEDFIKSLQEESHEYRKKIIQNSIKLKYRLSEEDFQTGFFTKYNEKENKENDFPLSANMISKYFYDLESKVDEDVSCMFSAISICEEGIQMWCVEANSPIYEQIKEPYLSIGSGSDISDLVLADFIEKKKRNKRHAITAPEGLEYLIKATKRSEKRNNGVGGTPQIGIIHKGYVYLPPEELCKLATEIVSAKDEELLKKTYDIQGNIEELMFNVEKEPEQIFEEVEKEFIKGAKNKTELSRYLRGYKR
jgi:hypothetical protein